MKINQWKTVESIISGLAGAGWSEDEFSGEGAEAEVAGAHGLGESGDGGVGDGNALGLGGADGEGESPEEVGVASFIANGGDAGAAAGAGDALGFAQVFHGFAVEGDRKGDGFVLEHL